MPILLPRVGINYELLGLLLMGGDISGKLHNLMLHNSYIQAILILCRFHISHQSPDISVANFSNAVPLYCVASIHPEC